MKKNTLIAILIIILATIAVREFFTINRNDKTSYYHWGMKLRMIEDFENFGKELQLFNDKLITTIEQDESFCYSNFQHLNFISDIAINNFFSSNLFSSSIIESSGLYAYEEIYAYANKNISTILIDDQITPSEMEYLQAFYNFNKELILEWENTMFDLFPNKTSRTSEEYDNAKLKIENIYYNFSQRSDKLISSEFFELHELLVKRFD